MKSTILGPDGQPIDLGRIDSPQSSRRTDSGADVGFLRREFDEHPARGLTPTRLNSILQAAEQGDLIRQLELADDMEERDTQIFSELAKRKTAVTMLDWDVVAPEDATPEEENAADQVRDWLQSIPNFEEDVLLELLDAILKGFKPIEMWWELDQGKRLPRFEPRPQRWLTLNETRDRFTLRDGTTSHGVELQPYNWLLHVHKSRNGYLARGSLCRVLAWPYLFKNYATRDLAEFLEIYGLPLRIGQYPAGASDDEKRKLLQAVVNIGHNAAGIIPQGMKIEFQNAAQGNHHPFEVMMTTMDAAESKAILGQTLSSSEGQHGTQALGNVHNEVRHDILKADAKRLSATITAQLVRPLILFNIAGVDPRRLRFVIDVPEPEDLQLYADAYPKLARAGMRIGVKALHRKLRIPMAEEGEELLSGADASPTEPQPPSAPASAPAPKPPKRTALRGDPQAAPLAGRDALDDVVDDAVGEWQAVLTPIVQPLLTELENAVARGESLEAFAARMPQLIERMDSRPLAEQLARANFVGQLAGEADLDLTGETV